MRKTLWVLFGIMIVGCTERETFTPVATPPARVADITESGGDGFVAEYFAPDNRHTARTLEELTEAPEGRAYLDHFAAAGFEMQPEFAFVLEGTFPDGDEEGMVVLPMTRPDTAEQEAVYIFHLWHAGQTFTAPVRLTNVEDDGPIYDRRNRLRFAENFILDLLRPIHDQGPEAVAASFSWRQWAECAGAATSAALISCALACRFFVGAQMQCFTVCAGSRTIGALAGCFVMQIIP